LIVISEVKENWIFSGRAEAKAAFARRECVLASKHFIKQYLESFESDPITRAAANFVPPEGQELK
jgi:hypothetical protein